MIEYLDRIGTAHHCELWLVRLDGDLGIARIYDDEDIPLLDDVETEARRWLGVEHAHLVPILSIERSAGRLVIITGDERGPSFLATASLLADPEERAAWAGGELAGIAEALNALRFRDRDFVHRDANTTQIVVDASGRAKLKALVPQEGRARGIAWTGRAAVIKSIGWMSPEQCKALPLTAASDVFTLASTLYAAIALKPPFRAETDFETLKAIVEAAPPPAPDCKPSLADLVLRNLARDPDERDAHPGAFGTRLRAIYDETPAHVRANVAATRPDKKPAPHESAAITGFRCAKRWEELTPTETADIRHCGDCKHDVVQVRSLGALIPLLGRRCVSYVPE